MTKVLRADERVTCHLIHDIHRCDVGIKSETHYVDGFIYCYYTGTSQFISQCLTITCSNWKQPLITDTSRIIMASIHILQCGDFSLDIMYMYKHSKWLDQWQNASFKYLCAKYVQYWKKITCFFHSVRHKVLSAKLKLFHGCQPTKNFLRDYACEYNLHRLNICRANVCI